MKKTILGILLIVGFLLSASESSTFLPNVIGLLMMGYSASQFHVFETKGE